MNQLWLFSLLLIGTAFPGEEHSDPPLNASFMVISDPHYYNPSLGTSGKAFETYLQNNGKLIRESSELVHEAVQIVLSSGVSLVLIPGDLTKDGALKSHLGFAEQLQILEEGGVQVFVVPGNHDVWSGRARSYEGDSSFRVPHVGAEKFAEIYGPFGYDEATSRDSNSLSYISEPIDGLWIIGLDPCLYSGNDSVAYSVTGGAFRKETLKWLETQLLTEEAGRKLKVVIMHHGILEHFNKQARYFDEYVVKDHRKLSKWLANLGVTTVFTGHHHANDITLKRWKDEAFLFDIETGSLLTYPSPLRRVTIAGDSMFIETQHIHSIPSMPEGLDLYARQSLKEGAAHIASKTMIRFKLNPEDAGNIGNQLGDLFANYCAGDEVQRNPPINTDGISMWGRLMVCFRKKLAKGLSTDLPPADNKLSIHLQSGEYD